MNPILYPKNASDFSSNGIGRLADCISCNVVEKLNGAYELSIVYPVTGVHFSNIEINSVIMCKHNDTDDLQPFEVYKITTPVNGRVTIFAQHISYRLRYIPAMPFSIPSGANACENTLAGLKYHAVESCPFTFWTNVHTSGSYNQTAPASIRERLGGVEGSVLDQFGGEYEWDKFTVKLHVQRGNANTGIVLKYGKNITDISQEKELSNVITGVVPYWINSEGDQIVTLTEKVVYSQYASNYPYHLTVPLDLSQNWENAPTESSLRLAAQAYVNSSELGIPRVSIKVSFVALWQTEEYKDIAPLERVNLGDAVTVYFETLGIEAFARVVATDYNVLKERYDSVEIGHTRSTLATTINDQNAKTIQSIENAKDYAKDYAIDAANNATKWLTTAGGYVIAVKNDDGSWKELVFSNNTNPHDSSAKILRINNNGIGFSQNGMDGTYTSAWTIDGHFNADFITTGTLIASIIKTGILSDMQGKFSLNMETGDLLMKSGTFKGTLQGATINGGTLNMGGDDDGVIKVYDEYDNLVGEWTYERLRYKKGSHTIDLTTEGGNTVILFDEDSYIDGTGSGGDDGIHINADNLTFSVDDLHVTDYRGGSSVRTGWSGQVQCQDGYIRDVVNGLIVN